MRTLEYRLSHCGGIGSNLLGVFPFNLLILMIIPIWFLFYFWNLKSSIKTWEFTCRVDSTSSWFCQEEDNTVYFTSYFVGNNQIEYCFYSLTGYLESFFLSHFTSVIWFTPRLVILLFFLIIWLDDTLEGGKDKVVWDI